MVLFCCVVVRVTELPVVSVEPFVPVFVFALEVPLVLVCDSLSPVDTVLALPLLFPWLWFVANKLKLLPLLRPFDRVSDFDRFVPTVSLTPSLIVSVSPSERLSFIAWELFSPYARLYEEYAESAV